MDMLNDPKREASEGASMSDRSTAALLAEVAPDRREFVKRMLIGTGVGLAIVTSLFIPEIMAGTGRRRSPNGYD